MISTSPFRALSSLLLSSAVLFSACAQSGSDTPGAYAPATPPAAAAPAVYGVPPQQPMPAAQSAGPISAAAPEPSMQMPQGYPAPQPGTPPQQQSFPPQQSVPGAPATPPSGFGASGGPQLDALMEWERRDMGVPPQSELHAGAMHAPTPNRIPGGQVITTKGLLPLIQGGQVPVVLLHVIGALQTLPNAYPAVPAAQPGNFNDGIQQQLGQVLTELTRGNRDVPVVTYCEGPECWMSYNAALRAIALGYKNVLWYRGGMEAWQRAGLPFTGDPGQQGNSSQPGYPPPGNPPQQPRGFP